jgi:alanine racemase
MTQPAAGGRWAWADIDLAALDHNISVLRERVAPAAVWACVKAGGYGHGARAVAAQSLRSGAGGLCVALTQEGVELREAGIDAAILVLTEQPPEQLGELVANRLTPTVYSTGYADALARVVADGATCDVHLKVDTGMQRVGARPEDVPILAAHIRELAPRLRLAGVFTHMACADDVAAPANAMQLEEFARVLDELEAAGLRPPLTHAANSAGALAHPTSRFDMVRAGIAVYGISPGPGVDHLARELQPVLALRARVSMVKRVVPATHVSYGWRHRFERATTVATVPIGYADGVPRRLGTLSDRPGMEVLIGGHRHRIVGVVTMDQLMVDVGDADVSVGDEVVLIGRQGDEQISASDWAERLGTIGYEIVCGISTRVPRVLRGSESP